MLFGGVDNLDVEDVYVIAASAVAFTGGFS